MDLTSLRYFIETSRHRSISKASVALCVVQPALSRRIQLLEESLGVELLMRHRRGVEPTEAGRLIAERGELILRLLEQLEAEVRSQGAEIVGLVGLGFPPSIANLFVGQVLTKCVARYPRVELFLQEGYSPVVRDLLLAGRIDLGIMSCEARHPELTLQPLFSESMWLIGRRADWTLQDRVLQPEMLQGLPLLVGSFMRQLLKRYEARLNFNLRILVEVNSLSLASEALRAGTGFLVAPRSAVERELASGEFVGAPIDGLTLTRGLFYYRDRPLSNAALAVKALIEDEVEGILASPGSQVRRLDLSDTPSETA